ncbi:MAG: class sortase [Frankiales bacterium]|nr:class sortase [Frankiales bacterium]
MLVLAATAYAVLSTGGGQPPARPAPSSTPQAAQAVDPPTASQPAAPQARPALGPSTPVRLTIPALGVDTGLMPLDLAADGALEVPPAGFPAGWYTGAPTPGELGPAVLAGHVDWKGAPGVFYDLRRLAGGELITVAREDGRAVVFRVTRVAKFAKDEFPSDLVYGDLDHAGLRLITCGGSFDRQARSYVDNLVVFAERVDESPA